MLEAAIANTDLAEHRIAIYHGPTPHDKREAIKQGCLIFKTPKALKRRKNCSPGHKCCVFSKLNFQATK